MRGVLAVRARGRAGRPGRGGRRGRGNHRSGRVLETVTSMRPVRGTSTSRRNGGPGPRPGHGPTRGFRRKRGGRGGISLVKARPQTGNAECWVVSHNNGRRSYYSLPEAEDALGRYRGGECICCGRHDMPATAEFSSGSDTEYTESVDSMDFNPAVFDDAPPGVNEIPYNYFDSDDDDHAAPGITV